MSTRVSGPESPIIASRDELVAYLEAGSKPKSEWRIGTEHEKFGFYTADFTPVPYEGERGIRVLLQSMRDRFGWERCSRRAASSPFAARIARKAAPSASSPAASWSCRARRSRPCTRRKRSSASISSRSAR